MSSPKRKAVPNIDMAFKYNLHLKENKGGKERKQERQLLQQDCTVIIKVTFPVYTKN